MDSPIGVERRPSQGPLGNEGADLNEGASTNETAPVPRPGLSLWVATAGGVGFGPWAPGTWGALVAILLYVSILDRLTWPWFVALVVLVTAVGIWASGAVEAWFGKPDDGRIVIDEVAGQLIALVPVTLVQGLPLGILPVPGGPAESNQGIGFTWFLVVTAFVAFRWFDIRKPGPVAWAEKNFKGGLGVMADDVVAGCLAAVVVVLPAFLRVVASLRSVLEGASI
ncbi:MAG: phosphatidylglycerophosphatase A [Myxococcota bacterium]|nr:phosphatidylglycerophosphatase A [Myxococcota bacterium]